VLAVTGAAVVYLSTVFLDDITGTRRWRIEEAERSLASSSFANR
jgi:hypothetical protein